MSNRRSSQIAFKFQSPPDRVYRVGPGLLFTTIQSAINQAVLDGFTSGVNSCVVEVLEKGSPYVENLTLQRGIYLKGVNTVGSFPVTVEGNHSLALSNADSAAQNRFFAQNIEFTGVAGAPTLEISGTANMRVLLWDCYLSRYGINDGFAVLKMSCTNNNTRVRLFDTGVEIDDNTGTAFAAEVANGRLSLFGGESGLFGNSDEGLLKIQNSSRFEVLASSGGYGLIEPSGASLPVISVEGSGVSVKINGSLIELGTPGGKLIDFAASGTVELSNCSVTIYDLSCSLATGAAGNLSATNCTFRGISSGDVIAGASAIDPGITVLQQGKNLRVEVKNNELVAYVGQDGFPSIAEALSYLANATWFTEFKRILLAPGTYNESVTIPDLPGSGTNLTIEGDTDKLVGPGGTVSYPVQWNGNIDWSPANIDSRLLLKNILFFAQDGSSWFKLGGNLGSGSTFAEFQNISVTKSSLDTNSMFELSGGGASGIKFMNLVGCEIIRLESDSGKVFDQQEGSVVLKDCVVRLAGVGSTFGSKNLLFADVASGLLMSLTLSTLNLKTERAFSFSDYPPVLDRCAFVTEANNGEVFYFKSANNVRLVNAWMGNNNPGRGFSVARAGTQSVAAITIDNNSLDPGAQAQGTATLTANLSAGEGITVQGVSFIAGTDFAIGVDADATALNLANAVSASTDPAISGFVTASAALNVVTLSSVQHLASCNSYTLAAIGLSPITIVGFGGGADADGVDVNGEVFVVGDQFALGVDSDTTAQNLMDAINGTLYKSFTGLDPNLRGVAFGDTRAANVINLKSYNSNNSNALTLALFGPQTNTSILISGANFTGGANAPANCVLEYSASFLNARQSSSDIGYSKYSTDIEIL